VSTGGVFEKILQALATTDLRERGGIDLSESYIEGGTFIVAKKRVGERDWKDSRGAKVRRSSWQYQIVLAFLSPYTLRLLHHMKSPPLLKQLSPSVLSLMKNQNTL
jgi:hypothetical protein